MIETETDWQVAGQLAALGRFAAERGWVPATSGNFSARLDEGRILITRSGVEKGALQAARDFIPVALDAQQLPAGVSAETPLHVARYRRDPTVGAVVHVHSLAATLLSRMDRERGVVLLEGFEMQKALHGFTSHESVVRLPIFGNAQDAQALAGQVEARLGETPVPGYLLAGHGLYAWGATIEAARRHVEALEFLIRCALEERRSQS